jgi:hypothetical protein
MNSKEYFFYILAPDYTPLSSGRAALHQLCHQINSLGYKAFISSNVTNESLFTPKFNMHIFNEHKNLGFNQIAIYPEIEFGNPLRVNTSIRWLLNKPNFFFPNWYGEIDFQDVYWHQDDEFSPWWLNSTKQTIWMIDRLVFNNNDDGAAERKNFILYKYRNKSEFKIPDWVSIGGEISLESLKTPAECATLYKGSLALITQERTAAHAEAALCGCPTIFIDENKSYSSNILNSFFSIMSFDNFDMDKIMKSHAKSREMNELYDAQLKIDNYSLSINIENAINKYNYNMRNGNGSKPKSVQIEEIKNYINLGKFDLATDSLIKLKELDPICLRTNHTIARLLMKNRNYPEAAEILKEIINKLSKFNADDFFDKMKRELSNELEFCLLN